MPGVIATAALVVWASSPPGTPHVEAEAPGARRIVSGAAEEPSAGPATFARPPGDPGARCPLPGAPEGAEVLALPLDEPELTQTAFVQQGAVILALPPRPVAMLLDAPGLPHLVGTWDGAGGCVVQPSPDAPAIVEVDVRYASGAIPEIAAIHGCASPSGDLPRLDFPRLWFPNTTTVAMWPGDPCPLVATSDAGFATGRSPPVSIDRQPGAERAVTLVLPDPPYAGLGLTVRTTRPGGGAAGTTRVHPRQGGPAERAGLPAGARLLAVDGRPVEDLDPLALTTLNAGEPGTSVTLTLEGPDGPRELTVTRAAAPGAP